jgi:hypothetical protein
VTYNGYYDGSFLATRQIREAKAKYRQRVSAESNKLKKIKNSPSTTKINKNDFIEAFKFVDERFPYAEVLYASIYLCSEAELARVGYQGVGGFYSRVSSEIFICDQTTCSYNSDFDICINMDNEDILVHELIHYTASFLNRVWPVDMEEEYAYGYSVPFFEKKGWSEEEIIKNYFLPYFINAIPLEVVLRKVQEDKEFVDEILKIRDEREAYKILAKRMHEISMPIATDRCRKIYRNNSIYSVKKIKDQKPINYIDHMEL